MSGSKHFTTEQAKEVGDKLGIDWKAFDVEQFRVGMDVELEHGARDPETNVTGDDMVMTGKIAWAHLLEDPEYYTVLKAVEARVKAQERDGTASFLPSLHEVSATLGELTQRYAALTQHRVKILRRATALAATIATLEPTPRLLSDETALRALAERALTAADHLDSLATAAPAVKQAAQRLARAKR